MTKEIQKLSKTQEENWKDLSCKRDKQHSGIVKTNVEQKNGHEKEFRTTYGCMVESHERAESVQSKVQGMEKARDNSRMGFRTRQEQKRKLFWKHKETKSESTLLQCWTYATSKMQSGTQNAKLQRQSRAQEKHCKGRFWSLRKSSLNKAHLRHR